MISANVLAQMVFFSFFLREGSKNELSNSAIGHIYNLTTTPNSCIFERCLENSYVVSLNWLFVSL